MKILVIAVLVCFVMSGVPVLAAEETTEQPTPMQRLQQLRERYLEVRDQYIAHRTMYTNARAKWLEARERFATATDRPTLDIARNYLNATSAFLVRYLDVVKHKVKSARFLDEAKKAELTAELEGYMATLQADHEAIVAAQTKEEIRAAAKQAREDWNAIRPQVKRIIGEVLAARAQQAIDKAEAVSVRIDAKIAELQEAGKDTTRLEELNAEFKDKIALAQEKHDTFVAKLEEVKTSEDARGLLREADAFLRDANRYLVQSYRTLKEIIREIRQVETGQIEPEPTVVEVSEVTATPLTEGGE